MAKKPKVKCLYCGETFYREDVEYVQVGRRYCHKTCFDKEQESKTKEESDQEALDEYILKLFDIPYVTPRIKKQIKTYIENHKYSYSGIMHTLKFFFEVKGNSISKANGGIGIVSYVYDDAKKYYEKLYYAQNQTFDVEKSDIIEITIDKPTRIEPFLRVVDMSKYE